MDFFLNPRGPPDDLRRGKDGDYPGRYGLAGEYQGNRELANPWQWNCVWEEMGIPAETRKALEMDQARGMGGRVVRDNGVYPAAQGDAMQKEAEDCNVTLHLERIPLPHSCGNPPQEHERVRTRSRDRVQMYSFATCAFIKTTRPLLPSLNPLSRGHRHDHGHHAPHTSITHTILPLRRLTIGAHRNSADGGQYRAAEAPSREARPTHPGDHVLVLYFRLLPDPSIHSI